MKEIYGHRIWNRMAYQSCWRFESGHDARGDLDLVASAFCHFKSPEAGAEIFMQGGETLKKYSLTYDKETKEVSIECLK